MTYRNKDQAFKNDRSKVQTKPAVRSAPWPILTPPTEDRPSYLPWLLAAFFALVALFAFYAWKVTQDANIQMKQNFSALQEQNKDLQMLLDIRQRRSSELEQIMSILGKPGARILLLAGQAPAPSASAAILWNAENSLWLAIGFLPPAPEGKVYELWFVTRNEKIPAALLKTDSTGHFFAASDVPANILKLDSAEITLEPEGGSRQPTMPIYAFGKVN